MKKLFTLLAVVLGVWGNSARAQMDGSLDPASVVESWSDSSTYPRIIDINFSDTSWPDTWGDSGTGIQCPEYASGRYVNAVLSVPVVADGGSASLTYPVIFHNCIFANKESNKGTAGVTAAFARQFFEGQKATNYNDWTVKGHTTYLEDNILLGSNNKPVAGEAGFVQMCRGAAVDGNSVHGWMEIDHIPYVDRIQWSWSSTSWGRGIKCDVKIGDGEWTPLVWMGSEKQKQGWTLFSDQGYMMENVIDASDVSLRWRVWDGDGKNGAEDQVQTAPFDWQAIDPKAQKQAPRVHKLKIYGKPVTSAQADFARANPVSDPGELSDLSKFGFSETTRQPAPDKDAPVVLLMVDPDGNGDYTTVQAAIDAVPSGSRGIIYIAPGVYDENIYAGTKDAHDKFISLIGAGVDKTILTSGVSRGDGSLSYLDCAALNVFTPCFYAENLTIRNTSGNVGQAEALYTGADAHIFRNCRLTGFQDTYKANVGSRGYFTGCLIEGGTDFIYDGGLEWFDDCEIRVLNGGSYLTAPAESSRPMTRVLYPSLGAEVFYPGLFFRSCRLTAEEGYPAGKCYLGRPWKETCGAMFLKCILGAHIAPAGWAAWSGAEAKASLMEYRNINPDGSLADVSGRASFSRQASEEEVEAYITPEFLFDLASEVEFDYAARLRGVAAPGGFSVSASAITWEPVEGAAGYLVMADDKVIGFTPSPSQPVTDSMDGAVISVKAVSATGVTSSAVSVSSALQTLAFPSAEGFGKYATGGRGGKVVKVTSLADDGSEGTLRWAFNQHRGEPITIVFEVGGRIDLVSELRVNRSDWTLAGQTAPGDGILIARNKVNLGGSQNFIVRNVRFRSGAKDMAGNVLTDNACGAENCANFIFDHCSFGWSVEENMNTADSHFLTVQYSIVHEGLYNAGHSKGARGYGCQWGGSPATYHHNLLAHNNSRSCRFNGARGEDNVVFIEYINNVNYNYGKGGCYGGENTAAISDYDGLNSAHECNFIGNYYKPGPISSKTEVTFVNSSYAREGATSWAPAKWYLEGNKAEGFATATADNWKAMKAETYSLAQIKAAERIVTATPWHRHTVAGAEGQYLPERYMIEKYETADQALATVLDKAGTVKRDLTEARVISDVRSGSASKAGATLGNGIIDSENDAEGFFNYTTDYTVPVDTDGDGMPDEWESAHGLNPDSADDRNLVNAEGYTALEAYLNSLMGEKTDDGFKSGISNIEAPATTITYDRATSTLSVGPEAVGAHVAVYGTDGRLVYSGTLTAPSVSLSSLPEAIYLVRVGSPSLTPRVVKILR